MRDWKTENCLKVPSMQIPGVLITTLTIPRIATVREYGQKNETENILILKSPIHSKLNCAV
jgi:hypothetical protein